MSDDNDDKHWGDTSFGEGVGNALVIIAILSGLALLAWAIH